MTTTSSSRHLNGRRQSSTIPTPRIHSDIDPNIKISHPLKSSTSNIHRSKKSLENTVLRRNKRKDTKF